MRSSRIETMVLMAGFDLPVRAIREQIASALDLVVHTARLRDGSRKVIGVSEVVGMEGDIVTMQEIVRFSQRGVDKENRVLGEFCYSGVQPVCLKRFAGVRNSVRFTRVERVDTAEDAMVTALVPIAIFAGVSATVFFVFFSFWSSVNQRATARVRRRMPISSTGPASEWARKRSFSRVSAAWRSCGFRSASCCTQAAFVSLILLPIICSEPPHSASSLTFELRDRRRARHVYAQLEPATRLIAGGLRVGLRPAPSLGYRHRRAPDPARHEFRRVIGQTNLGASIFDAMDYSAERMPSHESLMLARVFRVQSETGGDLARILDQLADTIKDRRQMQRKISSLTAEGRMSAWVLMAIPICLGSFIFVTQQDMAHGAAFTR